MLCYCTEVAVVGIIIQVGKIKYREPQYLSGVPEQIWYFDQNAPAQNSGEHFLPFIKEYNLKIIQTLKQVLGWQLRPLHFITGFTGNS